MSDIKYPNVKVALVGEDGYAFSILGRVKAALKEAGVSQEERDLFQKEAISGDYDHLLQTVMAWVDTDSAEEEKGAMVECPSCNGEGGFQCSGCGGSGEDEDNDGNVIDCETCDGSGIETCDKCDGEGEAEE